MNTENKVPPPQYENHLWLEEDMQAKAEEHNWDKEGKLRSQQEKNHLWFLKVYGWVVLAFLICFSLLFLASLGSWAIHYLVPNNWHWLNEDQLSKVQSTIFSGSIGGIVSIIAQKQLSK